MKYFFLSFIISIFLWFVIFLVLRMTGEIASKNQTYQTWSEAIFADSWIPLTQSWKICIQKPQIDFFMYHYVRDYDTRDNWIARDLSIPPAKFREHMMRIRELANAKKISLMKGDDFLKAMKWGCFPATRIWIFSADDGWSDMYQDLVPIAEEYQIPFFLGIVTDFLDKQWFISSIELQELAKKPLVTIASHSVNHKDNSILDEKNEIYEVCESKKKLEALTEKSVTAYIYPSGRMNKELDEKILHNCGYEIAWSTGFWREYNSSTWGLFDLNRIRIHGSTPAKIYDMLLGKELLQKDIP